MQKNRNLAKIFDQLYSQNNQPYGKSPLSVVKSLPEILGKGKILDLGSGSGRNSLFLARKGFGVLAVDFSETALSILRNENKQQKIKVKTQLADLASYKIRGDFAGMLCTFALHGLRAKEALSLIKKMQKHTQIGGVNLLICFTKNSYFYKQMRPNPRFFPTGKIALESLYLGWRILASQKKQIQIRPRDAAGNPLLSDCVLLLAQKLR